MANIMSMANLKNKPSREGFDLSKKVNFTAKAGELLPVWSKYVLPTDEFEIDLSTFIRTVPLNTAAFARMRGYYDFYFVPFQLLWNKSNTVLTQMLDNPQHAYSGSFDSRMLSGALPYFTANQAATVISDSLSETDYFGYSASHGAVKLLDYLGYGDFSAYLGSDDNPISVSWSTDPLWNNPQFCAFKLAAYQKIYADYFRDDQWERINPSTFNFDYLVGSTADSGGLNVIYNVGYNITSSGHLFTLRRCNWQKDLFKGVLPRPQFGETAVAPIASNIDAQDDWTIDLLNQTAFNTDSAAINQLKVNALSAADGTSNLGTLSILALRQFEMVQKWKEIVQSGKKDYRDQISKIWDIAPSEGYSEVCEYLGGIDLNMDINEVVNSNITGDNSAEIAGKGTATARGSIRVSGRGRYGVVMCIFHCLPVLDYTTSSIDWENTLVNGSDFPNPVFDKIGMEPVYLANLINPLESDVPIASLPNNTVLGYASRYIQFKTDYDRSMGAFKTTLKNWIMNYDDTDVLNQLTNSSGGLDPSNVGVPINFTSFKVNPNCVDPIFTVQAGDTVDSDPFWCSCFFNVKAVRSLDRDGLPY